MHKGSCLCGDVRFEVSDGLKGATCCHCSQCRKQSGYYWASASAPDDRFRIISDANLKWHASSEIARRGFCENCGSFLFWKHNEEDRISISMSAFDTPTGLTVNRHIFVEDKGDYYEITNDSSKDAP